MTNEPSVRKLIQVTEEMSDPIHVPVVLGNELFVVTQRDQRRVEDSRFFTYNRINAKGEVVPVEPFANNVNLCNALLQAAGLNMQLRLQQQQPSCQQTFPQAPRAPPTPALTATEVNFLAALLQRASENGTLVAPQVQQILQQLCLQQQWQQHLATGGPFMPLGLPQITPMELTPNQATLQQQLDWSKARVDSSAPFPLHYNTSTSTTEISRLRPCGCTSRACNTIDAGCPPQTACSEATLQSPCVSAREQLKQRKMTRFAD